jgi:hypothetical protein
MSTITMYYNAGSEAGTNWTDESYAWNGSATTNYGYRTIVHGVDETTLWCLSSTMATSPPTGETIIDKVEVYASVTSVSDFVYYNKFKFCPLFNGSTSGTVYELNTASSQTTITQDITTSTNAPSTWTWDDVTNLDIKWWGKSTSPSSNYVLRVYEVWLVVTYQVNHYLHYRKDGTTASGLIYISDDNMLYTLGVYTTDGTYYAQLTTSGNKDLYVRKGGATYKFNAPKTNDATITILGTAGLNSGSGSSTANRLYVQKVTATATGFINYVWFYNASSNATTLKALVFDVDGVILINSGARTTTAATGWYRISLGGDITITNTTVYYIGYIISSGYYSYETVTGLGGYIANSYTTPTDFNPASLSSTSNRYNIYSYIKVAT